MEQKARDRDRQRHLVVVEHLGRLALAVGAHDLQQLARQLEGRRLKVDPARGVAEHEPEVDVDDVAGGVQQDVAIVAVLGDGKE